MGEHVRGMGKRDKLLERIRAAVEAAHGAAVTHHEGRSLVGGDIAAGCLLFADRDGATHEVQVDVVIGADGASSRVRELLNEQARFLPLAMRPIALRCLDRAFASMRACARRRCARTALKALHEMACATHAFLWHAAAPRGPWPAGGML